MLVPIIDGTKGRQDLGSRRAGGSRLASGLLLTAFRTRDHGKARSLGHRSGSGTIWGMARANAYQMLPAARLPLDPTTQVGIRREAKRWRISEGSSQATYLDVGSRAAKDRSASKARLWLVRIERRLLQTLN
jgi:hypothetical protein